MGFVYIFQNNCVRMDMQRNDENDQSGQCNGLLYYNPPPPPPRLQQFGSWEGIMFKMAQSWPSPRPHRGLSPLYRGSWQPTNSRLLELIFQPTCIQVPTSIGAVVFHGANMTMCRFFVDRIQQRRHKIAW